MKIEKGSFTPTYNITTVVLNDDTITPNRFIFWVDGTYQCHGYDDLTRQVCNYGIGTSVKNDRSIYLHNGTNAIMSGRVTNIDEGEFDVTFDIRTTDTVHVLAIED